MSLGNNDVIIVGTEGDGDDDEYADNDDDGGGADVDGGVGNGDDRNDDGHIEYNNQHGVRLATTSSTIYGLFLMIRVI